MKKVWSLLLRAPLLLGVCACGAGQRETSNEKEIAQLEELYKGRKKYQGDLHNHSDSGGRSDGKVPLTLWPSFVMSKLDMDFAVIVDHRQVNHMRLPGWDPTRFIGGTEPATRILDEHLVKGSMHYNMVFTDPAALENVLMAFPEYDYRPDPSNPGMNTFDYAKFYSPRFREVAQKVWDEGGFFCHVHPKHEGYMISDDPLDFYFGEHTGIEVMTGDSRYYDMHFEGNRKGYQLWVDLLNLDKRVYATFGSDDHRISSANCLSTIYSEAKHAMSFVKYLRSGDFTAGPVGIRMAMGDVTVGGETEFAGKRLAISVGDFHAKAVKPDHKYRLDVFNENDLVYSQEIDHTKNTYVVLDAENCKYYRANVYDVTDDCIFAVGNPIWNKK